MVVVRRSPRERFVVSRTLGEGATSQMFEVLDKQHGGRFALKRLRKSAFSPELLTRFKDEFRALEHISHRNLAKVFEVIADEDDLYLVMELIEGQDRSATPDCAPTATQPTPSKRSRSAAH